MRPRASRTRTSPGVYEIGLDESEPYLVLELVEGERLDEILRRGPSTIERASELASGIAAGLAEIHAQGFVHGDLKPANVIVAANGQPRILDFGLARASTQASQDGRDSRPSGGTPRYVAPERFAGETCDARGDVYAAGLILFELLTARHPFEVDGQVAVEHVLAAPPPPLSAYRADVPPELEAVLRQALARRPERRYASARELHAALSHVQPGSRPAAVSDASVADRPAFRGLAAFDPADRDRFFGRTTDVASLLAKLTASGTRFAVLYGESGSGKTSLLRAGLIPRLWDLGFVPLYVRSFLDPLAGIRKEAAARTGSAPRDAESLHEYLQRLSDEQAADVVVVLDQLEEFFVRRPDPAEWRSLLEFVARCCTSTSRGVRILAAIRSDFLHLVATHFAEAAPDALASGRIHHLRLFDAIAAAAVIRDSARAAGFDLEEPLVLQVAGDLARDGHVLPCEMQIVGHSLQAHAIRSLPEYRRAGGKEALVHGFLDDVVCATGHRELAWRMLLGLVSDAGTRCSPTASELASRVGLQGSMVESLLRRFTDARLVRELQDQEPWRYELMHEYLIPRIHEANGRMLGRSHRARRLLRQYLSAREAERTTRIPFSQALLIARHAGRELGPAGRALVRASLLRGAAQLALVLLALGVVVTLLLARASVRESWEGHRLRDGHAAAARRLAFTPDGSRLVSAGRDGTVIVWDFARRQRVKAWRAHTGECLVVAVSRDGRWIASGGSGPEIALWDAATLERRAAINGHGSAVSALGFSPDANVLASSAHLLGISALWRVPEGTLQVKFSRVSATEVGTPFFTGDGVEFAETSCNPGSGDCRVVWPMPDAIYGIDRTPDLSRALFVTNWGFAVLADVGSRTALRRERVHRDHGRAAVVSRDGRFGATAAEDIVLWDLERFTKLARFETPSIVWSLAFTPDGQQLVSSHADGSIVVWDVEQRRRTANLDGHAGTAVASAFAADGRTLATAGSDGSVVVWDVRTGTKRAVLLGHATTVNAVATSADGRTLASCDQDGSVRIWDADTLRLRSELPALDADQCSSAAGGRARCWVAGQLVDRPEPASGLIPCYTTALAPDSSWVATSWGVRDTASGRPLVKFIVGSFVYSAAVASDGGRLAIAHPVSSVIGSGPRVLDGPLTIYETRAWTVIGRGQAAAGGGFRTIAFSPDGTRLATSSVDDQLTEWDVSPLQPRLELGHMRGVSGLVYRPGGKELIVASSDRTISTWDLAARRSPQRIAVEGSPVSSIALSPDGTRLAATVGESVFLYEWRRSLWGRALGRPAE